MDMTVYIIYIYIYINTFAQTVVDPVNIYIYRWKGHIHKRAYAWSTEYDDIEVLRSRPHKMI